MFKIYVKFNTALDDSKALALVKLYWIIDMMISDA